MKTFFLLLLLGAGSLPAAQATNYYVAATGGSNSTAPGAGRSLARPFATIQYAANLTLPGDTVFVRGGTYVGTSSDAVSITRSGSPNGLDLCTATTATSSRCSSSAAGRGSTCTPAWPTSKSTASTSRATTATWCWPTRSTSRAAARPTAWARPIRSTNGNGISVDGRTDTSLGHPHHFRFVNNTVFECGGGGISAIQADYVTIENNLVYNNAWYTIYGQWHFPAQQLDLRQCPRLPHDCAQQPLLRQPPLRALVQPRRQCEGITDGNGIIIDSEPRPALCRPHAWWPTTWWSTTAGRAFTPTAATTWTW